jgi:hypothetical protein
MSDTPQEYASIGHYKSCMGEHPLGDLVDIQTYGPYVIERYERPLGHRRRMRQDKPAKDVISVHVRDFEHWREYREVFSEFIGSMGARDMMRRLDDTDTVEEWVGHYTDDTDS